MDEDKVVPAFDYQISAETTATYGAPALPPPYDVGEWKSSVFEKWSYNFCMANNWRVREKLGDFEDCMAQCALYFLECKKFYWGKINSQAQFMYMYKLWVSGQFHDLAKKDYKNRCVKEKLVVKNETSVKSDGDLLILLNEASDELKVVLNVFINSPKEAMDELKKGANTHHSGKFFRFVAGVCGFTAEKAEILSEELKHLLS